MALLTSNHYSFSLERQIELNVIIPTPEGNEQITDDSTQESYNYEKGLPVVYLLHGGHGSYNSWVRFSNIERYAQQHRCAVVMASAENSFYQDMRYGSAYHTFFSKELPAFVTSLFPVSKRREDTFIAGLSMGGYGAWFLALSNPGQYAKAVSLSGALDIAGLYQDEQTGKLQTPFPWDAIFEDPAGLTGSDADLLYLISQANERGQLPELYQACGTEDFLYEMNLSVRDQLKATGVEFVYEEGPGGHNWEFWDRYIQDALRWLMK